MDAGSFPIEVIAFGDESFTDHIAAINELNRLQTSYCFTKPVDAYRNWATRFKRSSYEASYVWDKLRLYRKESKGFHPFIIAIVHGKVSTTTMYNMFGTNLEREGFALATTADWEEYFAPPGVHVLMLYYFAMFAIRFSCPGIEGHDETRGCFFDGKRLKSDIKISMQHPSICDDCRLVVEEQIGPIHYDSLTKIMSHISIEYLNRSKSAVTAVGKEEKQARPKEFVGFPVEGLPMTGAIPHAPSVNARAQTVRLFYSYSHRDEQLRNKLEDHLAALKRKGVIENWHDRKIGAGNEWKGSIDANLELANVILLLVSSNFLSSNYCYDVEMKRAMERHCQGNAKVIPIILRPCHWTEAPFGMLQALPTDAEAVTSWNNRDEAFTDIAKGLASQIRQMTEPK